MDCLPYSESIWGQRASLPYSIRTLVVWVPSISMCYLISSLVLSWYFPGTFLIPSWYPETSDNMARHWLVYLCIRHSSELIVSSWRPTKHSPIISVSSEGDAAQMLLCACLQCLYLLGCLTLQCLQCLSVNACSACQYL